MTPPTPSPSVQRRPRAVHAAWLLVAMLPFRGTAIPLQGQTGKMAPPVDTTGLAEGPWASMEMLYERTIFNVDIFRLHLTFGPETADSLQALAAGRRYDGALADSLAHVALRSRNVLVRTRFLRDVGLDQFLDGLRDNLRNAREEGLLTREEEETIARETAEQYAPLADRGIREGETMWYRIRGDSLHVAFQARDGSVPVEQRPVGPERRLSVMAGYLAPGSEFREKLLRSLFR
ncbi:MAG: hypothetical protein WD960_06915 [Gemmatimonadota bacterium]